MRKFLLALALLLVGSSVAFADGIPQVVDASTKANWTRVVYNNSGSALSSGNVVIWDTSSTSFTNSGYPYITTTTTADHIAVAGITTDASCASGTLCEIVVKGPVTADCAQATDRVFFLKAVGTSSVAGQVGDLTPAADAGILGFAIGNVSTGADLTRCEIFVDTGRSQ